MKGGQDLSLVFETSWGTRPATGSETGPDRIATPRLNVTVIFTGVEATLAALREAATLANRLSGRITLLVPQVVPYPLPLTSPPMLLDWSERHFRVIAGESPVETRVSLYLCRDRMEALRAILRPHSLVVIGGKRRWWPTRESWLARKLRMAGHEVIFKQTE